MPVIAKTLRPCPEPKSTISGRTLFNYTSALQFRFGEMKQNSAKEFSVDKREFRIFPVERMHEEFPWQIWTVGWLAIFKAILWLSYEPNIPESILTLLAYKYTLGMLPFILCGMGVWNLRRWAVWGVIFLAIANLIFLIVNPQIFSGFLVQSEVLIYSVVLSSIVLVCNGPVGDIFILIAAPVMLKITKKDQD